jgi:hypothetical protein
MAYTKARPPKSDEGNLKLENEQLAISGATAGMFPLQLRFAWRNHSAGSSPIKAVKNQHPLQTSL